MTIFQISVKHFHRIHCISKYHLQNINHFIWASMCQVEAWRCNIPDEFPKTIFNRITEKVFLSRQILQNASSHRWNPVELRIFSHANATPSDDSFSYVMLVYGQGHLVPRQLINFTECSLTYQSLSHKYVLFIATCLHTGLTYHSVDQDCG